MNASIPDRRHYQQPRERVLKLGINDEQLGTLNTLERFGWSVKFVRATSAGPVAVVRDPDKQCLVVIEPDGQLNENPPTSFRG